MSGPEEAKRGQEGARLLQCKFHGAAVNVCYQHIPLKSRKSFRHGVPGEGRDPGSVLAAHPTFQANKSFVSVVREGRVATNWVMFKDSKHQYVFHGDHHDGPTNKGMLIQGQRPIGFILDWEQEMDISELSVKGKTKKIVDIAVALVKLILHGGDYIHDKYGLEGGDNGFKSGYGQLGVLKNLGLDPKRLLQEHFYIWADLDIQDKLTFHMYAHHNSLAFKDVAHLKYFVEHGMVEVATTNPTWGINSGKCPEIVKLAVAGIDVSPLKHMSYLLDVHSAKDGRVAKTLIVGDQDTALKASMPHTGELDKKKPEELIACRHATPGGRIVYNSSIHSLFTPVSEEDVEEVLSKALCSKEEVVRFKPWGTNGIYLDFGGKKHQCPIQPGVMHTNNNAGYRKNTGTLICFSKRCKAAVRSEGESSSSSSGSEGEEDLTVYDQEELEEMRDDEFFDTAIYKPKLPTATVDDMCQELAKSDLQEQLLDLYNETGTRISMMKEEIKNTKKRQKLGVDSEVGRGGEKDDITQISRDFQAKKDDILNNVAEVLNPYLSYVASLRCFALLQYNNKGGGRWEYLFLKLLELKQQFAQHRYFVPELKGSGGMVRVQLNNNVSVVELWLIAPERKCYKDAEVVLNKSKLSSDVLSTFTGFDITPEEARAYAEENDVSPEDALEAVGPWNAHLLDIICSGDEVNYRWLQKFFTEILEGKQTERVPCIIGPPGAGKTTVFETICKIIGPKHSCTVLTMAAVTHDKTNLIDEKVLVCFDESTFSGDKNAGNLIKGLVSNNVRRERKMYSSARMVDNTFNGLISSNSRDCFPNHTAGERRFNVLACNGKFAGRNQSAEAKRHFDKVRSVPVELIAYYYYFLANKDPDIAELDLRRTSTNETDWESPYAASLIAGASDPEVGFFLEHLLHRSESEWNLGPRTWGVVAWTTEYNIWRQARGVRQWGGVTTSRMSQILRKYMVWGQGGRDQLREGVSRAQHAEKLKEVLLGEKRNAPAYLQAGESGEVSPLILTSPVSSPMQRLVSAELQFDNLDQDSGRGFDTSFDLEL